MRDSVILGVGLVVGFAAGTLPIASEWGRLISRLGILKTIDPQEQSWLVLLSTAKGWLLWVLVVTTLAVVGWRRLRWPFAIFGVFTVLLICFAVRGNPSFHYLLPWALGITALFAAAAHNVPQRVQWVLLLLCGTLLGRAVWNDIAVHHRRIDEAEAIQAQIAAIVGDGVTVYSWRAPHPAFALTIMTDDPRDHIEVARRYPRDGVYTWKGAVLLPRGVRQWDYLVMTPERLRSFPQPVGPVVGKAGPFAVVRHP
jgi:hypothetical protein